jgi:hypothetical protein
MTLAPPIRLPDAEKLEILRRLDQFRDWHSLDEKRLCITCGRVIDGHQIQVIGGMRGHGPLRVICPTKHCHSIPMDWALPTPEMLAKASHPSAQAANRQALNRHDIHSNRVCAS